MREIDLDLLAALDAAATPGPWEAEHACVVAGPPGKRTMSIYDEGGHDHHDAALIAAMRNALPELLRIAREHARAHAPETRPRAESRASAT
jgi:hypothetical protein